MTRVEEVIAENRRRIRQTDARAIEVAETGRKDLSFGRNIVQVSVTVDIYRRDLGPGLVSGHPAAEHGSGRGQSGDVRGSWTLVEETTDTAAFTTEGANATRDALNGQAGAVTEQAIGSGSTRAIRTDTALVDEDGRRETWGTRTGNATTVRAIYPFQDHAGSVEEIGVFDETGRLLARATLPSQALTVEDEVRAEVTLTVSGTAPGSSVFTNAGEEAVAEALRTEAVTVGVEEIAFGTGTGDYSESSTGLFTEAFRKTAARALSPAALSAYSVVYASEPAGQMPLTLSEMGVFDNQNRMLWATTFEPFEKTTEFPFSATVGFLFE